MPTCARIGAVLCAGGRVCVTGAHADCALIDADSGALAMRVTRGCVADTSGAVLWCTDSDQHSAASLRCCPGRRLCAAGQPTAMRYGVALVCADEHWCVWRFDRQFE